MKITKQVFNRRIEEQRKREHEMAIKEFEGRSPRRKPTFTPSPVPLVEFPERRRKPTFTPSPMLKPYIPDVPTIQTVPTATQRVPSKVKITVPEIQPTEQVKKPVPSKAIIAMPEKFGEQ
jgi:hypothetical protein